MLAFGVCHLLHSLLPRQNLRCHRHCRCRDRGCRCRGLGHHWLRLCVTRRLLALLRPLSHPNLRLLGLATALRASAPK